MLQSFYYFLNINAYSFIMDTFELMDLDNLVDESEVQSKMMCGILYYSEIIDIKIESDETTSNIAGESLTENDIEDRIIIRKANKDDANLNELIQKETDKDFHLQRNSIQESANGASTREIDKEIKLEKSLEGSVKKSEDSLLGKNASTGIEIAAEEHRLPKIKLTMLLKLKEKSLKEIIQFCMDLGIIASKFKCPKCNSTMLLESKEVSDGYVWKCHRSKEKGHNNGRIARSMRTGSFFSISKLRLLDILLLIYCWVYKLPVKWVIHEFSFSSKTIFQWHDIFRDTCLEICAREYNKIGGKGTIVEIEGEKYIRRKNDENIKKDSFVFIGSEDMYGEKTFLRIVEKCDRNSFLEVIKTCVLPGSTVISEFCSVFECSKDSDFVNLVKTDKYKFKDPKSKDLLMRKKFWNVIRRKLPRHSKNCKYFDHHIAEFLWRKRNSCAYDKMRRFLDHIKTIYPPPTFEG